MIFDKEKIKNMSEEELKELHQDARRLEEEVHEIRRLAWKQLTGLRHERVKKFSTAESKEKKVRYSAKKKIKDSLKDYKRDPNNRLAQLGLALAIDIAKSDYKKKTGKKLDLEWLEDECAKLLKES